jgi:hypothetical protein
MPATAGATFSQQRAGLRLIANDIVLSDQPMVAHYLPQHAVRHLLRNRDLLRAMDECARPDRVERCGS